MAGVEWNCVNVYKIIPKGKEKKKLCHMLCLKYKYALERQILPVKNIGMEIKNPPTAHTRLTLDFCKYLLPLLKKNN